MRILVVGGGGREDALAAKLRADWPDSELFVAPGNPGTMRWATNVPIAAHDVAGLIRFAESESVDLTVVGPEQPLAAGIADAFQNLGLPLFGPTAAAARLESSKAFAKDLMRRHGIPTADFECFTDFGLAASHASRLTPPIVVKASGLAAGKGAMICESVQDAEHVLRQMLVDGRYGDAGLEVVIEEFLVGSELSVFFLADGERAFPMGTARDHKRRFAGDLGPNTGGMGAFSPVGGVDASLVAQVRAEIAEPVLMAMAAEGCPYRGFLYAGLMLTREGPKVIEFNCRLGDPEAQVVLPLLASDLVEPMRAIARGEPLDSWEAEARGGSALVTVVVSDGYPGTVVKGRPIEFAPELDGEALTVFHAGTAMEDGVLVTAGGRVAGVTAVAPTLTEAAEQSRLGAAAVLFEGASWRADIGAST
ncbi:MAG: phosphoribosylamine--glycine ligase [Gemmatimonadota bacterium]